MRSSIRTKLLSLITATAALPGLQTVEIGRDLDTPVGDGAIMLTIYQKPYFKGMAVTFKMVADNKCVDLPYQFNNNMGSYRLDHGLCDFFSNEGCINMIFLSKPLTKDYPVLDPKDVNQASSFKCGHAN